MMTFIDACLAGAAGAEDADTYVEAWHQEDSPPPLPQYLGMTESEYRRWVQDASCFSAILEARRAQLPGR